MRIFQNSTFFRPLFVWSWHFFCSQWISWVHDIATLHCRSRCSFCKKGEQTRYRLEYNMQNSRVPSGQLSTLTFTHNVILVYAVGGFLLKGYVFNVFFTILRLSKSNSWLINACTPVKTCCEKGTHYYIIISSLTKSENLCEFWIIPDGIRILQKINHNTDFA